MENFAYNIDVIKGINLSNRIPHALFAYIIDQTIKFTKNQSNEFDKARITEICLNEAAGMKESEIHEVLDSFVNISRFSAKKGLTAKNINSFLKDNTLIDEDKMNLFVNAYHTEISEQSVIKMIHLGKLMSMTWKVCSFLGDGKNKDVNKIYIELNLSVQNSNADIISDSFVLTLSEFKAFKEVIATTHEAAQQYGNVVE